jgi:hypothetical protein
VPHQHSTLERSARPELPAPIRFCATDHRTPLARLIHRHEHEINALSDADLQNIIVFDSNVETGISILLTLRGARNRRDDGQN